MGGGAATNPLLFPTNTPTTFPTSSSSSSTSSSSSSCSSNLTFPVPAHLPQSQTPCSSASSSALPGGMVRNSVLGPVPSRSEVDKAIGSLLGLWHGASSESWMDSLIGSDPKALISSGLEMFIRAFRLLQTEPAVKILVISLALDKAFWDAVMNNEAVRKVQELLTTGENGRPQISKDMDLTRNILSWFLEMLREKIMELVDKFKSLVNELTQPCSTIATTSEESKAQLEEKVRSSFLLSVVILFVVVLARITGS